MSGVFEVRMEGNLLPLPLWEREGARAEGVGRVRGTLFGVTVTGLHSPSSFRRFAPPSFSHRGRRI